MNSLLLVGALVFSFGITELIGPFAVKILKKWHFGQTIYELGPQTHMKKQGTPIMGGLVFAAAAVAAVLIFHPKQWYGVWDFCWPLLAVSVLSMLVGWADDFTKAVKKRHEGLTPWQKIAGQVIVAVAFSCYCYFNPQVGSSIKLPFTSAEWNLGVFYIPLMSIVIIFMVNSANLQDGLDGLLSGVGSVGSVAWCVIALILCAANPNNATVSVFAIALAGGLMGFLRVNYYPAKVFMGDTGSMFIGGAMVAMSMLLREPLLMLPICGTMVMSSVTVIIQRVYFKVTHGKRIFKMTPIHHSFEKDGYTEPQIGMAYAVFTAVFSIIAVLSVV